MVTSKFTSQIQIITYVDYIKNLSDKDIERLIALMHHDQHGFVKMLNDLGFHYSEQLKIPDEVYSDNFLEDFNFNPGAYISSIGTWEYTISFENDIENNCDSIW